MPAAPCTSSPPLKVVHVASGDRWGGAEAQLHTLLSQLNRMPGWLPQAVLLNDLELAQRLRDDGIPVTILPEQQQNILQLQRALQQYIAREEPALIHTHRQKENILGGTTAWRQGIPSVRTVHGASEHPPRGFRQLPRRAIVGLDRWLGIHVQQRIIAVSTALHQQLAQIFPPAQIVTIENGIDIAAIRAAGSIPASLGNGTRHIGIVGRLDPVKRIDLFLQMAARLSRNGCHDWRFHIFGEGALAMALQQQTASLGLHGQVTFHGHRQDIPACLAALDALVMCSDHEGLPMTALEAIAVGTPVLAHAVGGLKTILANGQGGLLVSDHSPEGYATGLQRLMNQDVAALIRAGQTHLAQRYSAAGNARAVARLYGQLLPQDKDTDLAGLARSTLR